MAVGGSTEKRLSISQRGSIKPDELETKHLRNLLSLDAKLSDADPGLPMWKKVELEMAAKLAEGAGQCLGYGLRFVSHDDTSLQDGTSLVFTNGTGLFAVVLFKHIPECRGGHEEGPEVLMAARAAALLRAQEFKQQVVGPGTLVWAALQTSAAAELEWVAQPSLPEDLEEVELPWPATSAEL